MGSAIAGYQLDNDGFRLYDGTQNDYGAPSGPGVTAELPSATGNAFFRGIVTASMIQGPRGGASGTGARMWFDFTAGDPSSSPAGSTAGVSPYWGITDDSGVIRVEAGLLTTLGISPTQWGLRVNDQNGSPIFDSLGLIAVMKTLLILTDGSGDSITSTIPVVLGGMTGTIVLPRASNLLISAFAAGKTSGASGTFAKGSIFIDGVLFSQPMSWDFHNTGVTACSIVIPVDAITLGGAQLTAGSHTIDFRMQVDSGQTWINAGSALYVFTQGA